MSSLDYLDLCRLCLVKDRVSMPIFEGEGDVRQIFLKITACLPVKVAREDKLPKKICDDCVYKVELIYQFWHTTANAEKQLLQWLGDVNMEDKQGYVGTVLNPNGMKPEQSNENRLDGTVMQQVSEHQNNMTMNMMDNMGLTMPLMMSSNTQQQITSVPIDNNGSSVQNVQAVAGPSTQTSHDQIMQNQTNASTQQEEEEESSEEEENSDDECDGDEGLPIKEESEEDPNNSRTIEPTTFVNVSLACDEAGPSGLQQQKIADMPEMVMSQPSDVDPKTGFTDLLELDEIKIDAIKIDAIKIDAIKIEGSLQEANTLFMEASAANKINNTESSKENKNGSSSYDHYACNICAFPCQTKGSLIKHMQLHEHTCTICNGLFESSKKLQTHMAISHGEAKYLCKLCNTTFWSKPDLRKHFMTKHLNPFCNTCTICNQEFQTMYAITRHMHCSHSSVSVTCTICKCEFSNFTALRSHNKHVHLKSGFQCGICGRRDIFSVVDLETHLRRHRDKQRISSLHVCTTCGQCFDKKPHLSEHMIKYHDKTNPYVCPVCKKSFEKRSNQIQHILTHMHNVYACDICGARFPRRSSLICHRKMHPGPLGPLPIIPVTGIVSKFVRDYLNSNKDLSDP